MFTSEDPTQPISAAESTRHQWKEVEDKKAREHDIIVRELELEYMKGQTRWQNLLKLPIVLIMLPVYIVLAIGLIPFAIKGDGIPEEYWQMFKH